MFDKNFFPTPTEVIQQMVGNLNLKGKVVLEPQAGSGNIIDALNEMGAKTLACELNEDLAIIASQKADNFICRNFFDLTSDQISHCNYIVMNPPFDNADKHILHALEIAPGGCEIISLVNAETFNNSFSRTRQKLYRKVSEIGEFQNLGNVFSTADRKTDIDIGLIKLFKPKSDVEDEFDGFMFSEEEEEEFFGATGGLIKATRIREIVGRYIQAVQRFDDVINSANEINKIMKPLGGDFKIQFDTTEQRGSIYGSISREQFKTSLQKSAWKRIFAEMKMEKYLTKGIMDSLNKKIESQITKPLTERNIFSVVQVIVGTHGDRMQQVLVDVFDWLTDHYHDNRKNVEGWKTNSMYFVAQKFIAPYSHIKMGYRGQPEFDWRPEGQKLDELVKALCILNGTNYDDCNNLHDFFRGKEVPNEAAQTAIKELAELTGLDVVKCTHIHESFQYFNPDKDQNERRWKMAEWKLSANIIDQCIAFYAAKNYHKSAFGTQMEYKQWGKWYKFNFFEIKVYKKGTVHAKFMDKNLWEEFNKAAVKAKGWQLPERTGSDFRRKSTEMVKI